jgi:putative oxidoreductase
LRNDCDGNTEATEKHRSALTIGPWALRLAVAFVFVSSGLEKFGIGSGQEWIRIFAKIGLGDWFRYLTGAMEITGGLLLLVSAARKVGVVLLVTCMAGAVVCHVLVLGDPFSSIINVSLTVAILGAGRQSNPEDEDLTKLELH